MPQSNILYYVIFGVVVVVLLLGSRYWIKFLNSKTAGDFLSRHPDAARVYTSDTATLLKAQVALGDNILITKVDGVLAEALTAVSTQELKAAKEQSANLFALQQDHLLIIPGQHTLSLAASHSRPGVVYKTVATTYGPIDYAVDLQPGRSYQLSFDRNAGFSLAPRES